MLDKIAIAYYYNKAKVKAWLNAKKSRSPMVSK